MGDWLEAHRGAKQYAFADALKRYVAEETGIPWVWTQTQEGKETWVEAYGMTVRDLLIKRGQEIRAEQRNPGFFAKVVADQIKGHMAVNPTQTLYVITDWRLPEELVAMEREFLRYPMVLLRKVRIERMGQIQSPVEHWTETALAEVPMDAVIWNPGDETLWDELSQFAKKLSL